MIAHKCLKSLSCYVHINCQHLLLRYGRGCHFTVKGQGKHSALRTERSCVWSGLEREHEAEETARNPRRKRRKETRGRKKSKPVWRTENEQEEERIQEPVAKWQERKADRKVDREIVFSAAHQECILVHNDRADIFWLKCAISACGSITCYVPLGGGV